MFTRIMSGRRARTDADLSVLLTAGTLATLSDSALLDLFESPHQDAGANRAFEVLVTRHGSMVLRIARSRLASDADAHDAFQATFWLLARRSQTIRHRDALAAWLFGVASRVAARAAVDSARRRTRERQVAVPVADSTFDPAHTDPDLASTVQAEVNNLPTKYRVAIVLCDLEGLSCDEAAHRLGCPVGTFKARLSRGRARLRDRLARRGLAPSGWAASPTTRPLLIPAPLVQATCRLALAAIPPGGPPAAISTIITLALGVSRTMFLLKLKAGTAIAGFALAALLGAAVTGRVAPRAEQRPTQPGPPALPPEVIAPAFGFVSGYTSVDVSWESESLPRRPDSLPPADPAVPLAADTIRQAFAAAEAMPDIPQRTRSLVEIGRVQLTRGDHDGARATFRAALAVMTTGKPTERWGSPHPVVQIAQLQALNGDKDEAHATLGRAGAVLEALPLQRRVGEFCSAVQVQQRLEGRAASRDMVESFRKAETLLFQRGGGPKLAGEEIKWLALSGEFDRAIDVIEHSPDFHDKDTCVSASLDLVKALMPGDPPTLIDSIRERARRAVLAQSQDWMKFGTICQLIAAEAKVGRFDHLGDLDQHFDAGAPADIQKSNHCHDAQTSCRVARDLRRAGRTDEARRLAQRAVDRILPGFEPGYHWVITAALEVILDAGGLAEATRIYATLPADYPRWLAVEPLVVYSLEHGQNDEACRWATAALALIDARLVGKPAGHPEDQSVTLGMMKNTRAKLARMVADVGQIQGMIAATAEAYRQQDWPELAGELVLRGRIAEALNLVSLTTDPDLRREIQIKVATMLPIPNRPPAPPQPPPSDAAR